MSIVHRRVKNGRGYFRPSSPLEVGEARKVRIRSRYVKAAIVALTVLSCSLIVYGTGLTFTYRVGQVPSRPILTNVERFQRRDPQKTNAQRRTAAESVAPLLVNDPEALREIQEQFEDLVDAASRVQDLGDLPPRYVRDWSLKEATFLDLRKAIDSPERLASFHAQIQQAFEPILRAGVLGPDALPGDEQLYSRPRIVQVGENSSTAIHVDRDRIVPERLAKPDSLVAIDFAQAFASPRLAQELFPKVAEKIAATPTLRYEDSVTKQDRDRASALVPEAFAEYRKGDLLVDQNEPITEDHLSVLRLEHQTALSKLLLHEHLLRGLAVVGLVSGLFALIGYSLDRRDSRITRSDHRLAVLCGVCVLTLGLARLVSIHATDAEIIPVALAGMILAIAYSPEVALVVTFGLSLLTSLALGSGLGHFIILMGGTAAAVLPLREVRTRTKPIQVGMYAAVGYFVLTWTVGMYQNQAIGLVASDAFWRAGWGMMAGFFLGGLLPFVERGFGIITGISLLELGDVNHPLLQELVQRAPGTYNHSETVGTIAAAAAERIGANSLVVRIGAYFHDVGKMLKPHYFIENQVGGVNKHNSLNPAMSTLIIIGHVKDGFELGRQHHLPEPILDLITQHHGTTLVEYFYREATRRSDGDPDSTGVEESAFRYPGPRPQSKEAGILMISDAVESASRTLSEPTPARLEGLVSDMVRKRLEDGQLDECGLTLKEIAEIQVSLVKSLIGIYHGRVKYPGQRSA